MLLKYNKREYIGVDILFPERKFNICEKMDKG